MKKMYGRMFAGLVAAVVVSACALPPYPANGPGCLPVPPEPSDYASGRWHHNGAYYGWAIAEDACINPPLPSVR